ncbi:MAG: hypothetical protein GWO44_05890 [Thermoplasmata archaeon]|nr:hypothetical protein [Thermoplasmata archaeon]NIY02817.1 hypothetical protein [Thermoplasmata archaeon]
MIGDTNSGGGLSMPPLKDILFEGTEDEARDWMARSGFDPDAESCPCCGGDWWFIEWVEDEEGDATEGLPGLMRCTASSRLFHGLTLRQYLKKESVLLVRRSSQDKTLSILLKEKEKRNGNL